MSNLIATAPTLDAIGESIARFYCGESKTLMAEPDKADSWLVIGSDGNPLLGVRVIRRRNRYRFEMIV